MPGSAEYLTANGGQIVPAALRRALRVLGLAIVACLAVHAAYQTAHFAQRTQFLYDNSHPESAIVERTLAAARGEALYAKTDVWPYNAAVYGPLFYRLPGLVLRALGSVERGPSDVARAYYVGRAFSLLSGLLILGAIWMLCGALGLTRSWRALGVLLFFSAPMLISFGYSFRPDFSATALGLWAWVAALRMGDRKGAFAAAALMVLAILYKQTSVISALALFLTLLAGGRKRSALYYAGAGAILSAIAMAGLLLTEGQIWLENGVFSLSSPFYLATLYQRLFSLSAIEAMPFVGGFAACLGLEFGVKPESRTTFRVAFATLFIGFLLASLRVGSSFNYLLESYCWGAVLTAACASRLLQKARDSKDACGQGRTIAVVILLCALMIPYLNRARTEMIDLPNQCRAPAAVETRYANIAEFLRQPHGEILTTQGYLWWMTPDPPTMMDGFLYSAQVAAGRLSTEELPLKIIRQDFGLIATHWDMEAGMYYIQGTPSFPPEVEEAILLRYVLWCTVDGLRFYVPAGGEMGFGAPPLSGVGRLGRRGQGGHRLIGVEVDGKDQVHAGKAENGFDFLAKPAKVNVGFAPQFKTGQDDIA